VVNEKRASTDLTATRGPHPVIYQVNSVAAVQGQDKHEEEDEEEEEEEKGDEEDVVISCSDE